MFRISAVRSDAGRRSAPRRSAWWVMLGLPALVPAILAVAEVTSLSVSPTDISSRSSATGTVKVSGFTGISTRQQNVTVTLANSNPSVLIVPATVVVGPPLGIGTFTVSAVAGAAGCGTISARVGTTPTKSTVVFVPPPPAPAQTPLRLAVPAQMVGVPTTTTGTVSLLLPVQQPPPNGVVQLTSSNPAVRVPPSVTVALHVDEMGVLLGQASFPITLTTSFSTNSCSVITGTTAGAQGRGLLKILPSSAIGG